MPITVKDILSLEIFKDAEIVAGKRGINKVIHRVSFSDCPLRIEVTNERIIMPGDFFIGSLYIYKEDYEALFENIKYYVEYGASGICLINEYFANLPQKVIDYSDKNDFVIIIVDKETPYADLIHAIMESIIIDQMDTIKEMKIDYLLNNNISKNEVIKIAKFINSNFRDYYISIYFTNFAMDYSQINFLRQKISFDHESTFLKYKKGNFIIINYEKKGYGSVKIDYILEQIKSLGDSYIVGVSSTFDKIENLDLCLKQAIIAHGFANKKNNKKVYYDDLGLFRILFRFKDTYEFERIYGDLIKPLKDYDSHYDSHLLETVIKFVEMNGDYKKTAIELFLHENTVRYRINKVKRILNVGNSNLKFYEQISLIEKLEKIANMSEILE